MLKRHEPNGSSSGQGLLVLGMAAAALVYLFKQPAASPTVILPAPENAPEPVSTSDRWMIAATFLSAIATGCTVYFAAGQTDIARNSVMAAERQVAVRDVAEGLRTICPPPKIGAQEPYKPEDFAVAVTMDIDDGALKELQWAFWNLDLFMDTVKASELRTMRDHVFVLFANAEDRALTMQRRNTTDRRDAVDFAAECALSSERFTEWNRGAPFDEREWNLARKPDRNKAQ